MVNCLRGIATQLEEKAGGLHRYQECDNLKLVTILLGHLRKNQLTNCKALGEFFQLDIPPNWVKFSQWLKAEKARLEPDNTAARPGLAHCYLMT